MSGTFSIKTLGCKLNQYESGLIAGQFTAAGWDLRPFGDMVDVVIVNTCTVTDRSDKKCRNYIRQGARFSRLGKAVVTGCMAERDAAGLLALPEVLAVFNNSDKSGLPEKIQQVLRRSEPGMEASRDNQYPISSVEKGTYSLGGGDGDTPAGAEEPLPLNRTRGFLKIQDGCDGTCSYCIVPSVRGGPRSREFRLVVDHARKLIDSGCPELVLTGITIGKYESGRKDLADLVEALALLDGDFRLRVTSIEPKHVTERLVGLLGSARVCPHIHLPLQSGSDRILRLMQRPYSAAEYMGIVDTIRKKSDKIALGTDVIIGFPGEEESDFLESLQMVERAGFSYVHQFSFSPRSGTPASAMNGACPERDIARRSSRMRELGAAVGLAYRKRFEGEVLPCVVEANRRRGGHTAVSGNYIKMELRPGPGNEGAEGRIAGVRLVRTGRDANTGELVPGNAG